MEKQGWNSALSPFLQHNSKFLPPLLAPAQGLCFLMFSVDTFIPDPLSPPLAWMSPPVIWCVFPPNEYKKQGIKSRYYTCLEVTDSEKA